MVFLERCLPLFDPQRDQVRRVHPCDQHGKTRGNELECVAEYELEGVVENALEAEAEVEGLFENEPGGVFEGGLGDVLEHELEDELEARHEIL